MRSKWITFILISIMVLSVVSITGCGTGSSPEESAPSAENSTEEQNYSGDHFSGEIPEFYLGGWGSPTDGGCNTALFQEIEGKLRVDLCASPGGGCFAFFDPGCIYIDGDEMTCVGGALTTDWGEFHDAVLSARPSPDEEGKYLFELTSVDGNLHEDTVPIVYSKITEDVDEFDAWIEEQVGI